MRAPDPDNYSEAPWAKIKFRGLETMRETIAELSEMKDPGPRVVTLLASLKSCEKALSELMDEQLEWWLS